MIEIRELTKRYGSTLAVDHLSCDIKPGYVTGFLGPNGAGKSTTMRMILGLDNADHGTVRIDGRRFRELERPMSTVGALIDAKAVHGGRSARDHLLCLAQSNRIPAGRVDAALEAVGLTQVARRRIKGFSLGMSQRLGIAAALLGDPRVLLFDEPVNGLDPEGIRWIRDFMRALAAEGRTVFVSSHLMSEMALTAEHLIVIGRGRLIADTSVEAFVQQFGTSHVLVRSPEAARLVELLRAEGASGHTEPDGALNVSGVDAARVGEVAAAHGVVLHELSPQGSSLEEAYLAMTAGAVEYQSSPASATSPAAVVPAVPAAPAPAAPSAPPVPSSVPVAPPAPPAAAVPAPPPPPPPPPPAPSTRSAPDDARGDGAAPQAPVVRRQRGRLSAPGRERP